MWIITGLVAFILVYYKSFTQVYIGGDDIWLYMSAPGGWGRVLELFSDIGGTYRPTSFSLFAIYHWLGGNIAAMHWVPIAMHGVNVVLVYLVALQLSKSKLGSVLGAIIYGVSPIVFFDVYTLTGLVDQLFLLFGLGSILALLREKVGVSWILFILAMFSKESFVSILLVISYLLWQKRSRWQVWGLYWVPATIYVALKLIFYIPQGGEHMYTISLDLLGRNLFDYGLWLINWRHGWQMGMPYEPHPYYDLVSLFYAGLLSLSVWKVWQKNKAIFWVCLWWGIVGLLPFYFLGRAMPYYLEFSLVGMAILVASGIDKMKAKLLYSLLLIGVTLYMSLTTRAQWVTYSFSANGVQAAEKFRDQVVNRYDWSKYDTLCLTGMNEYELWATGVGKLANLYYPRLNIVIDGECSQSRGIKVKYNLVN